MPRRRTRPGLTACLVDGALANNMASAGGNRAATRWTHVGAAGGAGALLITYGVGAAPAAYNQTGVRRFCSAEDGVLRANPNTGALDDPGNGWCSGLH